MRKQDKGQLSLFMMGLRSRFSEKKDYFISCDVEFKSGTKLFRGTYTYVQDQLMLQYNGVKTEYTFENFLAFFEAEALKYESAVITYNERGASIEVRADEKGVKSRQVDPKAEMPKTANPLASGRDYIIKVNEAPELLRAIGVLTKDGKLRNDMIRKYNQIDHFLELVRPMLEADTSDTITVLDCGCGKSYLTFVLNYFIRQVLKRKCFVTGVDRSEIVIEDSKRTAAELGYRNMEFIQADLRTYTANHPTMVISLHACDTATDMAMGLAVRSGAKMIACVPCCHKELIDQYDLPILRPITDHGVFRARFNDVLTDGLRMLKLESCGYKTSVVEYVSPLDTPKNLLIRATKVADENEKAKREYYDLINSLKIYPAIERECEGLGEDDIVEECD